MSDMQMLLTLRLRDDMSARASKALRDIVSAAGGAVTVTGRLSEAENRAARSASEMGQAARGAARATGELATASERVARTNMTGLRRGLEAATQAGKATVRVLGDIARGAATAVKAIGQMGAGMAAAGAVGAAALKKPVEYEERLALMANTAFADRDVSGRRVGMRELRGSVDSAVRAGGGSRESAAEALDAMIASGAVRMDAAKSMLPVIQKFATSTGAQSTEIANILIRGIQNKYFTPEEAEEALNKALVAGQEGGFELKDMARWLPQMMASATGMRGMRGFERLLASAQASVTTAGSKDMAGNNLVNLLAKMNSADATRAFADRGIDLPGTLARAREKGQLPLDAFVELLDREVVGKDKNFQALKTRAAASEGTDRAKAYEDMADILQASAVGGVIADRQALLALVAEMTQRDYIRQVMTAMQGAGGAVDVNYGLMRTTTAFSASQAATEKDIAAQSMLDDVGGPLRGVLHGAAALAREFPVLATVATEAATAIAAMTAAAAAWGGIGMLTRGGGAAAGAAGAGRLGALAARAGSIGGRLLRGAGRAAVPLAVAGSALDVYGVETDPTLTRAQKNAAHTGTAAGLAGAWAGAKLGAAGGAALGSVVPGLGTAVGGAVGAIGGGLLGWWGGEKLGDKLGKWLFGGRDTNAPAGGAVAAAAPNVAVSVTLDGREIAARVEQRLVDESRRH